MGKQELLKQAERAERLADQSTDDELVHVLRDAAEDYRHKAEQADEGASSGIGLNG